MHDFLGISYLYCCLLLQLRQLSKPTWLQVWRAADDFASSVLEQAPAAISAGNLRPSADQILGKDAGRLDAEEVVDMLIYVLAWLKDDSGSMSLSGFQAQLCVDRLLGKMQACKELSKVLSLDLVCQPTVLAIHDFIFTPLSLAVTEDFLSEKILSKTARCALDKKPQSCWVSRDTPGSATFDSASGRRHHLAYTALLYMNGCQATQLGTGLHVAQNEQLPPVSVSPQRIPPA